MKHLLFLVFLATTVPFTFAQDDGRFMRAPFDQKRCDPPVYLMLDGQTVTELWNNYRVKWGKNNGFLWVETTSSGDSTIRYCINLRKLKEISENYDEIFFPHHPPEKVITIYLGYVTKEKSYLYNKKVIKERYIDLIQGLQPWLGKDTGNVWSIGYSNIISGLKIHFYWDHRPHFPLAQN